MSTDVCAPGFAVSKGHETTLTSSALFSSSSAESDGEINAKQLGTLLRSLGQNPTQAELDDMVIEVDDDGDGAVDFQQFLTIMARTNQTAANDGEEIDAAFKAYDKDGTGYISAADLKNVMTSLGMSCLFVKKLRNNLKDEGVIAREGSS